MAEYTMQEYHDWILSHKNSFYTLSEKDNEITLQTSYATGVIEFVEIMNFEIIQMQIVNKKDDDVKFYIHFELLDKDRAHQLYEEMEEELLNLKNQQKTKVLLCCTGGLTTSYFATKLNETSDFLKANLHFDAVDYTNLYTKGFQDYSAILLAPQIKHILKEAREVFKDMIVLPIPTRMFGSYDTGGVIELIRNSLSSISHKKARASLELSRNELKNNSRILSLTISIGGNNVRVSYATFANHQILYQSELVKSTFDLQDLKDLINTIKRHSDSLDCIGICMPGIINNGTVKIPMEESSAILSKDFPAILQNSTNLKEEIEKEFGVPVVLNNTTDMSALGYYITHGEDKNIVFHSHQLMGGYGEASIVNGQLIHGKNNIAGEINFLGRQFTRYSQNRSKNNLNNPRAAEKLISQFIIANICLIGPDIVCVSSLLVTDTSRIIKRVSKEIPEEFLPEIIAVSQEEKTRYMLLGNCRMCEEEIDRKLKGMH